MRESEEKYDGYFQKAGEEMGYLLTPDIRIINGFIYHVDHNTGQATRAMCPRGDKECVQKQKDDAIKLIEKVKQENATNGFTNNNGTNGFTNNNGTSENNGWGYKEYGLASAAVGLGAAGLYYALSKSKSKRRRKRRSKSKSRSKRRSKSSG